MANEFAAARERQVDIHCRSLVRRRSLDTQVGKSRVSFVTHSWWRNRGRQLVGVSRRMCGDDNENRKEPLLWTLAQCWQLCSRWWNERRPIFFIVRFLSFQLPWSSGCVLDSFYFRGVPLIWHKDIYCFQIVSAGMIQGSETAKCQQIDSQ